MTTKGTGILGPFDKVRPDYPDWTDEEKSELIKMIRLGHNPREMAQALNKTPAACSAMKKRLKDKGLLNAG